MKHKYFNFYELTSAICLLQTYCDVHMEREIKPCACCGGRVGVVYMQNRNYMFRCEKCGMITIIKAPSEVSAIDTMNGVTE